ncbi:MAG TPA: SCO family protein [Solirubrobacteraceae bacterium]|nr:SCO family protein [Solirubrobacteraceae bacterium]
MQPKSRIALAIGALAALAAVTVALVAAFTSGGSASHPPPSAGGAFKGAALVPSPLAPPFTLTDLEGDPVRLTSLRGEVVVIAFLDSTCSPGCVLVAQQVRGALDELEHRPQVLFVSLDPGADTPASVRTFLQSAALASRVRWLVGPPRALRSVWRAYRVTTPSAGRAAFERALQVLLIDADGRERVLFEQEQLTPEALAHDIRTLQSG